tara:strand:- start:3294 stop:3482 length:189 start_codon:yes stop_codon:yes gene_type:complete
MGPKLIQHTTTKCPNTGCNITLIGWRTPSGWTKEESEICQKYYQLQASKLGMGLERYMKEFH